MNILLWLSVLLGLVSCELSDIASVEKSGGGSEPVEKPLAQVCSEYKNLDELPQPHPVFTPIDGWEAHKKFYAWFVNSCASNLKCREEWTKQHWSSWLVAGEGIEDLPETFADLARKFRDECRNTYTNYNASDYIKSKIFHLGDPQHWYFKFEPDDTHYPCYSQYWGLEDDDDIFKDITDSPRWSSVEYKNESDEAKTTQVLGNFKCDDKDKEVDNCNDHAACVIIEQMGNYKDFEKNVLNPLVGCEDCREDGTDPRSQGGCYEYVKIFAKKEIIHPKIKVMHDMAVAVKNGCSDQCLSFNITDNTPVTECSCRTDDTETRQACQCDCDRDCGDWNWSLAVGAKKPQDVCRGDKFAQTWEGKRTCKAPCLAGECELSETKTEISPAPGTKIATCNDACEPWGAWSLISESGQAQDVCKGEIFELEKTWKKERICNTATPCLEENCKPVETKIEKEQVEGNKVVTCKDACGPWGAWGNWMTEESQAGVNANEVATQTRTRTRACETDACLQEDCLETETEERNCKESCNAACGDWGGWSAWSPTRDNACPRDAQSSLLSRKHGREEGYVQIFATMRFVRQ